MNKIAFLLALALLMVSNDASAQYYYYDWDKGVKNGFRLDVNAGLSVLYGNLDGSHMDLDRSGLQIAAAPTYVFKSTDNSLGITMMLRQHSYEHRIIMDKIDMNVFYIGPTYTWVVVPYNKGSFFFDTSILYGRVNEKGNRSIMNRKRDTFGFGLSAGYGFKILSKLRMTFKCTWMFSTYNPGEMTDRDNISTFNFTTGFWLWN